MPASLSFCTIGGEWPTAFDRYLREVRGLGVLTLGREQELGRWIDAGLRRALTAIVGSCHGRVALAAIASDLARKVLPLSDVVVVATDATDVRVGRRVVSRRSDVVHVLLGGSTRMRSSTNQSVGQSMSPSISPSMRKREATKEADGQDALVERLLRLRLTRFVFDRIRRQMEHARREATGADRRELALALATLRDGLEASDRAKSTLVEAHLSIVVSIARTFAVDASDLAELVREGNIRLLSVVDDFDPALDQRFETLATHRIRAAMALRPSTKRIKAADAKRRKKKEKKEETPRMD